MCGALLQQHLALGQRLAHQRELVVLEVAQAAVDQLGRRRRGVRREVVLLAQHHAAAAAGEVARDAGAVDAAADDQHVAAATVGAGAARLRLASRRRCTVRFRLVLNRSACSFES